MRIVGKIDEFALIGVEAVSSLVSHWLRVL